MITKINRFDTRVYELKKGEIRAYISIEEGMSLFELTYKETKIIPYNKERHENGMTHGIPLLYPTPNRTREEEFIFQNTRGKAIAHGFLRHQGFVLESTYDNEKGVGIVGSYVVEKGSEVYKSYPFESKITVEMFLTKDSLVIEYKVENLGDKDLPYGFALHPFFSNQDGKATLLVTSNAYMEMCEDKLPTGKIIKSIDKDKAIDEKRMVKDLSLDHVYINLEKNPDAILEVGNTLVTLNSSEEFNHMVVFTPDKPFFCVENQTCSTDAINMHQKGYEKESGLIILKPKEEKKGYVSFELKGRVE